MRRAHVVSAAICLVGTGGTPLPVLAGSPPVPVGEATAISPGVDVRSGAAGTYAAVTAPVPVAVGDGVRTDATGFGEVAYDDGSRTRLDVSTEFEVLELVDGPGGASTRTAMNVGRTWHRVESAGEGDGAFSVETSQATAAVTGTAFAIECTSDTECSFLVVEGSLRLTLPDGSVVDLVAPSSVDVVNGVAGPILPVTFDDAFGDPWLLDNGVRDTADGFADPASVYQAHGPEFAALAGEFTVIGTVTDSTCAAACYSNSAWAVGDSIDFTVSVGTSTTWTESGSQPCGFDDDGDGAIDRETGSLEQTDSYSVTPTASEVRDGIPQVTAFTGTRTTTVSVPQGTCDVAGSGFVSQSWTLEIVGSR